MVEGTFLFFGFFCLLSLEMFFVRFSARGVQKHHKRQVGTVAFFFFLSSQRPLPLA
jgi:hypothetical protein